MYRAKRIGVVLVALLPLAVVGPVAQADPPTPPDASTSRAHLDTLTVEAESHADSYDRELFPHWIDVSGSCNTRESVLQRDGDNVSVGSDCYPTSGSWTSPYDGATWTDPSDIDIDHMVPLAEAWTSGAWNWTTERRQQLANDLSVAQLWAVTDNVNQTKSDQDPAEWKPPQTSIHCLYARSWIDVKYTYSLTVDNAEKSALSSMLDSC